MKPIRGFSLMELMVVVIIISLLAGLSLAYGIKPIESAKAKGARAMLDVIYAAEKEHCTLNNVYTNLATLVAEHYLDDPNDPDQNDWAYTVSSAGVAGPNDCGTFLATATRQGIGSNSGEFITIDESGQIDDSNWTP